MKKHTPGPWHVNPDSWIQSHSEISAKHWGALAVVVTQVDGKPSEEGKANAQLMAVSPELLAALEGLLNNDFASLEDMVYQVREIEGKGWNGPGVKAWSEAVTAARDAVAKATGEDQ
jgi:hypothetical protein